MIPVRLLVENFLPYRAPGPLDLTGVHIACLTGHNGAGKSSLLDAMTWALWGEARDGKRSDDELIYHNANDMQVQFEFELGGQRYLVVRKRSKSKRGQTVLELQGYDAARGGWSGLSEATIKGTQDKINALLRMDYATFCNSAFLQQGQADSFTKKTPAKRKEILYDILGLKKWEEYEVRAKNRVAELKAEIKVLAREIEMLDGELRQREDCEKALEAAQEEVKIINARLTNAEAEVRNAEDARQQLLQLQRERERLTTQLQQEQQELAEITAELTRLAQIGEPAMVQAKIAQVEAQLAEFEQVMCERETLQQQVSVLPQLEQQLKRLQDNKRQEDAELTVIKKEVAQLKGQQSPAEVQAKIAEAEKELAALEAVEQRREAVLTQINTFNNDISVRRGEMSALSKERDALKKRIEVLKTATEAVCPTCGQVLSEEKRGALIETLTADLADHQQQMTDHTRLVKDYESKVEALEKERRQLDGQLKKRKALQDHAADLQGQLKQAEMAAQLLQSAEERYARRQAVIARVEAELARVSQQIAECEVQERALAKVEERLAQRPAVQQQLEALRGQLGRAEEAAKTRQTQQARAERWQASVTDIAAQLAATKADINALEQKVAAMTDKKEQVAQLRLAQTEAQQKLGGAQQRLSALDAQAERRQQKAESHQALGEELRLFSELQKAFGRAGVPAMIIEAAVPEIEEHANVLLGRMTSGRMTVAFETQHETKQGNVQETLNIQIADELGTRDYEMYSGGEAFRVNFAIRVALSKLLARRAGAELRTLMIDEGFGTQDAQGREHLVDAITAIQTDFDRILVITHIEELKDSFPVRIEVRKTAQGSVFELV